jgi:ribose 5-phosphate isomerase B
MKVAIASDHAGFQLKQQVNEWMLAEGYDIKDLGTNSPESTDYSDYGHKLAEFIKENSDHKGIAICGSGNGINITVNKHQGIRGALCWNKEISKLARAHNDANICSLPGRFVSIEEAKEIIAAFMNTPFEGGRHQKRIDKIPLNC